MTVESRVVVCGHVVEIEYGRDLRLSVREAANKFRVADVDPPIHHRDRYIGVARCVIGRYSLVDELPGGGATDQWQVPLHRKQKILRLGVEDENAGRHPICHLEQGVGCGSRHAEDEQIFGKNQFAENRQPAMLSEILYLRARDLGSETDHKLVGQARYTLVSVEMNQRAERMRAAYADQFLHNCCACGG